MAELRRTDGTRSCLLTTEHLVGRGAQCALRLAAPYVSTQHALIRWSGHAWELLDRASRNGTRLNGETIEPGRPYRLNKNSQVSFGHPDERWELADAGEPETMAVALDTEQALRGTDGWIGLPSSQNPEATLFLAADGAWKLERADGELESVVDGQIIDCAGRQFRFCTPASTSATEALSRGAGAEPTLVFVVSSDEVFVELSIEYGERRVSLGSRSHNYLLLTLARRMLLDRAASLPEASCGWTDKEDLAEGLKMTPQQVDGEVFRIRKHFTQHGVAESTTVVERRPRTKQMRLGVRRLRIERH